MLLSAVSWAEVEPGVGIGAAVGPALFPDAWASVTTSAINPGRIESESRDDFRASRSGFPE